MSVSEVAQLELLRQTREEMISNRKELEALTRSVTELTETVKTLAEVESRLARLEDTIHAKRELKAAILVSLGGIMTGLAALVVAFSGRC